MKKIGALLCSLLLLVSGFLVPAPVSAAVVCPAASGLGKTIAAGSGSYTFTFDKSNLDYDFEYWINVLPRANLHLLNADGTRYKAQSEVFSVSSDNSSDNGRIAVTVSGTKVTAVIKDSAALTNDLITKNTDQFTVTLVRNDGVVWDSHCTLGNYYIQYVATGCSFVNWQERDAKKCYSPTSCIDEDTPVKTQIKGLKFADGKPFNGSIKVFLGSDHSVDTNVTNGESGVIEWAHFSVFAGSSQLTVKVTRDGASNNFTWEQCQTNLSVSNSCNPDSMCSQTESPVNVGGNTASEVEAYKLCAQIDQSTQSQAYDACMSCAGDDGNPGGIWTAIGCIPRAPGKIAQALITVGLGIGGGVGLISVLVAGFLYSISAGDLKRTGQAKEMLTNSLIGLLFIIFSVTILQFIGYNVLRIPGFGG